MVLIVKTERDGYWYKDSSNKIRYVKNSKETISMKYIASIIGNDTRFLITKK